jgi:hypothetical protein
MGWDGPGGTAAGTGRSPLAADERRLADFKKRLIGSEKMLVDPVAGPAP